jgi:hypothetical protein
VELHEFVLLVAFQRSAMGQLLAMGPDGRRIMGETALRRVRERFTTSALQKATLAVYEGLTGQAR